MYQSIYRKYRPQTFSEVYGQNAIATTLTNAIKYDRVAHAYLFSGPRGTGKTSSAKLLAKALNCTNIVDGKICDTCENCLLIKENAHPDVIEIDAASNNGVEEVRDLIEKVKYSPIKGNRKVYIIDEVHMMSQGAFNALLKTLEEPPDHVVFILATTEHHKVLATIKSRCQKFNFKKISESDIVDRLENILEQEDCQYDKKSLEIIASLSEGGMRDALSILEQVMIYSNNDISVDMVYDSLDLVHHERIMELYNLITNKNLYDALAFVERLDQESVDYKQLLGELIKISMEDLINLKVNQADSNQQLFLLNFIEKLDESLSKLKLDSSKKLYLDLAIIKAINYGKNETVFHEFNSTVTTEERKIEDNNHIIENYQTLDTVSYDESKGINEQDQLVTENVNDDLIQVVNNTNSILDDKELMNVLVQANRSDLDHVKSKWSILENYLFNVNTKQIASLLIDGSPVAASKDAIIIVGNDLNANNQINSEGNINVIGNFIKQLTGQFQLCFAIDLEKWRDLKNNYMQLRSINKLPEPFSVLSDYILVDDKTIEKDSTIVAFGKELFKDKLIMKSEEENNEY